MFRVTKEELKRIVFIGKRKVGKALLADTFLTGDRVNIINSASKLSFVESKTANIKSNRTEVFIDIVDINSKSNSGETIFNNYLPQISTADFAVVVLDATKELDEDEEKLIKNIKLINLPFFAAVNKIEFGVNQKLLDQLRKINAVHFEVSCKEKVGVDSLKARIINSLPAAEPVPAIEYIVNHGDVVLMVVPDELSEVRKGLYNTQIKLAAQTLTEDAVVVVTKETLLKKTLSNFKYAPELIIADSRIIKEVTKVVPKRIKLTTFSILMAKQKGDLLEFVNGLNQINRLEDNNKILIFEACPNHPLGAAASRIKIPRWLKLYTKKKLQIEIIRGGSYPINLNEYRLIILCSGCLLNKKFYNSKINEAKLLNIPITSYGVLIAYVHNAIPRAIMPFKEIMNKWEKTDLLNNNLNFKDQYKVSIN